MGAIGAIPAGQSVVVGGEIPYLPEALAKRAENRAGWPASDPEAKCYMPGIPRATYMPYPFQIVQGEGDTMLFSYTFANANRPIFMRDHQRAPVDLWMGRSNGSWDGDTLVIEVNSNIENTWLDRAGNHHSAAMIVLERYTLIDEHVMQYEATIEDPETFSRPWTIRMPLYRRAEADARLLEFNCVKFSEPLLYGEFEAGDAARPSGSPRLRAECQVINARRSNVTTLTHLRRACRHACGLLHRRLRTTRLRPSSTSISPSSSRVR